MIKHLQGREKALEPFGWTGHEAEWIALVCLHSGVFTRAQFCFHLSTSRMRALRFVRLLVSQGIAAEIPIPDRDNRRPAGRPPYICRISNRQIYQALGAENTRPGKTASPEILMRGLLSLDYVLEHTELAWLPTEQEKVRCFETLDLDRRLLPRRVYQGAVKKQQHYFALKLPVAVDSETATFVYVDPGHETDSGLHFWGEAHGRLWAALRRKGLRVQAVAVAKNHQATARAEKVLRAWRNRSPVRAEQAAERLTQDDPSVAQEMERIELAIRTGDRAVLAEYGGDGTYVNPALKRLIELRELPKTQGASGVSVNGYAIWRARRFTGAGEDL